MKMTTAPHEETTALDLWDRTEERAVLNLVPNGVQAAFLDASRRAPDLFQRDERDLFKELRSREETPSPTDNRLRLAFWLEYDRAQMNAKRMEMLSVYTGICTKQYFFSKYLLHPGKVAWLLCPPADYETKMAEGLSFATDQMRQILEMDHTLATGGVNFKLLELKTKIWALMDLRSKGAHTQKIETKSMNLHVSTTDKGLAQAMTENSMEAMDRRLKELDRRERVVLNLPNIQEKNEPVVLPPDPGGDARS
jgi:hypothetical protein